MPHGTTQATGAALASFPARLRDRGRRHWLFAVAIAGVALVSLTACATQTSAAQPPASPGGIDTQNPQNVSAAIQILLFVTVLSLAPAILVMVTSFTRIIVVLSLVRNAIGIPQLPPNQVLIGLALFLTAFVMAPAIKTINSEAVQPYLNGTITQQEAFTRGESPLRAFMLKQTREQDLGLFLKLSDQPKPETKDDVPTYVLVPAFTISELKTAFQMGFVMFVPFLIIDLVVSSALLSMGMMMLPPVIVSLPFKILLFVMVDGWYLIIGSLVGSFN
jgi:flagellar biosynthetic protein FliP